MSFKRYAPTRFTLHELDVFEYLTATDVSYSIIVAQGLFAFVDEVFQVVSVPMVPKTFVERPGSG